MTFSVRAQRLSYRKNMVLLRERAAKLKRAGECGALPQGPPIHGGSFAFITPWFTDEKDGLPTRRVGDIESATNGP